MVAELLKYGVVLPAAIAAVCGLSLWVRSMTPGVGRLIAASGVGLGWLGGIFLLGLAPWLPETAQTWHWLPALAVLAIIAGRMPEAWPVRLIVAAGLGVVAAFALIPDWESIAPASAAIADWFRRGGVRPDAARSADADDGRTIRDDSLGDDRRRGGRGFGD